MEISDEKKKEMEDLLEAVMAGFQPFQLSDRGRAELKKFFQFRMNYERLHRRALRYNLLIQCENSEEAVKFVQEILRGLHKVNTHTSLLTLRRTEKELRDMEKEGQVPSDDVMVLIITEGAPIRRDSVSINSSSVRGNLEQARKEKDEFWKRIVEYSDKKKDRLVIAVGPKEFQDYIRESDEMFYRFFAHHIRILPWTVENVIAAMYRGLEEEHLSVRGGFRTEIEKYIQIVYPKADLQDSAFVDDLLNRILVSYYTNPTEGTVTEACVPYYRRPQSLDKILAEINDLVGLENVKKKLKGLYSLGRQELSQPGNKNKLRLHFAFVGNPGTGKTTVAGLTAEMLYSMGLIRRNKVVHVAPADVISVYKGEAPKLMREKIDEARGGVLFIDEAYFLNSDTGGKQSEEAKCLEILLQEMENHPDELSVIFAGYQDEITNLLKFPGLGSRVPYIFEFEDYTDEELLQIFLNVAARDGMSLAEDAHDIMLERIALSRAEENFGNARTVEVMCQQFKSILLEQEREELIIMEEDIRSTMPMAIHENLDNMIGLETVKQEVKAFESRVRYIKYLKDRQITVPAPNMHMLFTGNPGTGKTTVAKKIADCLYRIGILKTNKLVVAERRDLVAGYVGQTAPKTAEVIQRAMNGVLFIDEAYSLSTSYEKDFGPEAIQALITAMEDYKDRLIIVFAGYQREMQNFVNSNPGIASRIGFTFHFPDYTPDELSEMFERKMSKSGFIVEDSADACVRKIMEYFSRMENFGNGRFVDKIIDMTINKRAERSYGRRYNDISGEDIPTIQEVIAVSVRKNQLATDEEQSESSRRRIAVHEAGHAIVTRLLHPEKKVVRVSINADAASLGRSISENVEGDCMTETELKGILAALLAGRNAERLVLGDHSVGVSNDIERAKSLVKYMIGQCAMGELGVTTEKDLLREADRRATDILTLNRDKLEQFAELLYERETLNESDLKESGVLEGLVC